MKYYLNSIVSSFILFAVLCGPTLAQVAEVTALTASDATQGDKLGSAVHIDGNRAILGAFGDDEEGVLTGAAYMYEWNGSSWIETAKLTASDAQADNLFGTSVALDGDRAVVGAYFADIDGVNQQGAAYIFEWNGSSWIETEKLTASDGQDTDRFGISVSLDGDRLIVGAFNADVGSAVDQGAAYVFEWDGTSWNETAKLTASDGIAADNFARSVSLDGDRAAIGSRFADIDGVLGQGAAYIFEWDGALWNETAKLTTSDGEANDFLGESIALQDDRVVIAAHVDDIGVASDQGSAYVFDWDGSSWIESAKLTSSSGEAGDLFGFSLALDGDLIVVGALGDDEFGFLNAGSATVFELQDSGWVEILKLIEGNPDTSNNFGRSVAVQERHILVGSLHTDKENPGGFPIVDAGAAYMFELEPLPLEGTQLPVSDGTFHDFFGEAVSIHGDRAVVGAYGVDGTVPLSSQGAAYIYEWDGTAWIESIKLTGSDSETSDQYGNTVSIYDNRVLVGSPFRTEGGFVQSGGVYVYEWDGFAWIETDILIPSDARTGDNFGQAISLHGNRAIIGSRGLTDTGVTEIGAAYIFEWDGSTWNEIIKLAASDAASYNFFGKSVAIYEDKALVGAFGNNGSTGAAYVYEWDGSSWNETSKLIASDGIASDHFGFSVALHGNKALVGAAFDDVNGIANQGSAYLYEWNEGAWIESAFLSSSSGEADDRFGSSVALTGNLLVAGAGFDDESGLTDAGSATVFEYDGSGWVEYEKLTESNQNPFNRFGESVAVDGNRVLIGASLGEKTNVDGSLVNDAGAAYVFDLPIETPGELTASPLAIDFEFVEEGASSAVTPVTLTNTGTLPINITDVVLSGDDAASFSHSYTGAFSIPGGSFGTIDVTFTPPAPDPDGVLYRVNAGGSAIDEWNEDTAGAPSPYLLPESTNIETTGDDLSIDDSVPADTPLDLFASMRLDANQDAPAMEWDFPVTAGGQYEVRMYFAEMSRCKVGNRVFDVEIEGTVVLDDFDIYSEAGSACEVGVMRSHTVTAEDDTLDINFPLVNGKPSAVSGFEVIVISTPPSFHTAQFEINHTGSNGPLAVDLSGETGGAPAASALSVSQDAVSFGITEEGAVSEAVTLTLSNDGPSPIDISSVTLEGANNGDFTHTFAAPLTLGGGSTSTFDVAFAPQPAPAAAATPLEGESILYRINAGGALVDDWEEDTSDAPSPYILAGSSSIETDGPTPTLDATVPAGTPTDLFTHKRIDANKPEPYMEWDFPVEVGSELTVNLFFVEMSRCSAGSRVFDVTIDGAVVLDDFDVYVEAGNECNQGTMRSVTVTATDDNLDIDFPLVNGKPAVVAAIEILGGGTAIEVDNRMADLLITHTGSNPTLSVALSGEATASTDTTDTGGGGNAKPVAAFTYQFLPGEIDNALLVDVSTDSDGEIITRQWDVAGAGAAEDSVSAFQDPDTPFTVTLTVTDDGGESSTVTETITLSDITLTEIDGMVVFEAENYVTNDPFENHSWTEHTAVEGFSGLGAMQAQPNDGTVSNGINSTHMTYEADFTTGGTYYLWARVYAETTDDNSLHMGDNGSATAVKANQNTVGAWSWTGVNTKNNALDVDLSVGMNTIDVWMREDGLILDKIIVTTDELFVAEGLGPDESQRKGIAVATNGPDVQVAAQATGQDGPSKIASTEETLPESFVLHANYPNPFNPVTTIEFELPESAAVRLEVFDMMGRRVATLVDQQMHAGRHQTRWDARSDTGSPVASGVYIYRMQAGSFEAVEQMILMK